MAIGGGLLAIDKAENVCIIIKKKPYNSTTNKYFVKVSKRKKIIHLKIVCPFLEMLQIPRGRIEKKDGRSQITAIREFREETKCLNSDIIIYNINSTISWTDAAQIWDYDIFLGKSNNLFKFDTTKINLCPTEIDFRCSVTGHVVRISASIDRNTVFDLYKETLLVIKIHDYITIMKEQLLVYSNIQERLAYKQFLDVARAMMWRKPSGSVITDFSTTRMPKINDDNVNITRNT